MSATNKKAVGLDSKPAIREAAKMESERFSITEMNYKNFFEDIANLAVEWSAELYKNNPSLNVTTQNKKFIETIKWSDVDLKDDIFVTRMHLASLLPTQPAAKLQKIEDDLLACLDK